MIRTSAVILAAATVIGCAPRYRKQVVGTVAAGSNVAVRGGDLHVASLSLDLPRAMRVRYRLICPDRVTTGVVGETREAYERRRLAELQRERDRKVGLASLAGSAILGRAGAGGAVSTPAGGARVDAEVDGAAVGAATADRAIAPVKLDPRDTGARTERRTLRFVAARSGACALSFEPAGDDRDLRGVRGQLTITRLIDRRAEERRARIAAATRARKVRVALHASLVAQGADPHKRARERAAERARAEAAARARRARAEAAARARRARAEAAARARRARARVRHLAELESRRKKEAARRERELRLRLELSIALGVRGQVVRWLGECGGDPDKRRRELAAARERLRREKAARRERERRANEANIRQWEAEVRRRRQMAARGKLLARLRTQAALDARAAIKVELHGLGAMDRPAGLPEPEPTPGTALVAEPGAGPAPATVTATGAATATVKLPGVTITPRVIVRPRILVGPSAPERRTRDRRAPGKKGPTRRVRDHR